MRSWNALVTAPSRSPSTPTATCSPPSKHRSTMPSISRSGAMSCVCSVVVEADYEAVLGLFVLAHRFIDHLATCLGRENEAAPTIGWVRDASDEPSSLESVTRRGHAAGRHHAMFGKLGWRAIRRTQRNGAKTRWSPSFRPIPATYDDAVSIRCTGAQAVAPPLSRSAAETCVWRLPMSALRRAKQVRGSGPARSCEM